MALLITRADEKLRYRVTGKQSIERLEPLIIELAPWSSTNTAEQLRSDLNQTLDFVWETTCEKDLKELHQRSSIYNRLHNSQIIESKASFAALQLLMDYPTLETKVASTAQEVEQWAKNRWGTGMLDANYYTNQDWWVVKASKGNGGRDIWIFNRNNFVEVIPLLPVNDEYVIQR